MKETENDKWPIGVKFNNVSKTDAASKYPDIVTVRKYFETSGHDALLLDTGSTTFVLAIPIAELVYRRYGINRPEIF